MIVLFHQHALLYNHFKNQWQFKISILSALLLSFEPSPVKAQYYEYELKSGFIYQFARFTNWSEINTQYFQIGILGEDPFGDYLKRITNDRLVHGKLVSINQSFSVDDLKDCQIIFVSKSEEDRISEVISKIDNLQKDSGVLTIGDAILDFCKRGGMINFTEVNGNSYFFNLNVDAISKNDLVINSKILKIAHQVISNQKQP